MHTYMCTTGIHGETVEKDSRGALVYKKESEPCSRSVELLEENVCPKLKEIEEKRETLGKISYQLSALDDCQFF